MWHNPLGSTLRYIGKECVRSKRKNFKWNRSNTATNAQTLRALLKQVDIQKHTYLKLGGKYQQALQQLYLWPKYVTRVKSKFWTVLTFAIYTAEIDLKALRW